MPAISPRPIHHVTMIASDARATLAFYRDVLGLRLVKRTVNFDDPGTYHLYFGDELAAPGTLLTFFPYAGARPGRAGAGQASVTSLAVPAGAIGAWVERLVRFGVPHEAPVTRFGLPVLGLRDPDGLLLELVGAPYADAIPGWAGGPVPAEHAVRGVHGVTLWEDGDHGTSDVLTGVLGFAEAGAEGTTTRYLAGAGIGATVEVRQVGGFPRGTGGAGTVHHVAFRAEDGVRQRELRMALGRQGIAATDVIDRQYFESIYFREPGGVLFEIATDGPGFTVDEPLASLGRALLLPPQYEAHRAQITKALLALPELAEEVVS